jgi:acyl carrier protein
MTEDSIREIVLRLLKEIAPEANPEELDPHRRIRDQIDIDSMDALNFLIAVHEETGVDIPESDYPKLATLDAIVSYLTARATPER